MTEAEKDEIYDDMALYGYETVHNINAGTMMFLTNWQKNIIVTESHDGKVAIFVEVANPLLFLQNGQVLNDGSKRCPRTDFECLGRCYRNRSRLASDGVWYKCGKCEYQFIAVKETADDTRSTDES